MKQTHRILMCLAICAFAALPAQAFVAKSLTITLQPLDGDARIDMQYELTFIEQSAGSDEQLLVCPAGQPGLLARCNDRHIPGRVPVKLQ